MGPGRIVVIGEPEAVLGLGLLGLEGRAATTAKEAHDALDWALGSAGVAMILLTEEWAEALEDRLDRDAVTDGAPMIIEIPSSRPVERSSTLRQRVERTLGIRQVG